MNTPKWAQKMLDAGVHPAIVNARMEKRRASDREWAKINADKKREHKRAYKEKLKKAKEPVVEKYKGTTIPSAYHADWKQMPTYRCPELTYRGQV